MHQALTTMVENSPIDLALAGWLDAHKGSAKTKKAYADTLQMFRASLQRTGQDLDGDVTHVAMVAQAFASITSNPHKEAASNATCNQRLAILSSFYEYALARYLLMPMDAAGHVMNPIKLVKRAKVQAYAGASSLEASDVAGRLKNIDRRAPLGKRDYALLAILLQTGRRLSEVAALQWQHVQIQGQKITLIFEQCKGGKTMRDTLPAPTSKALLEWLHAAYGANLGQLANTAPVWISLTRNGKQRGQPLGIQSIADLCEKHLGISKVHATRHTWAHSMIKAGATVNEIQARLGHESLATTGRYLAMLQSAENKHADTLATMLGIE